jgi:hypothetical protein
VSATTTFPALNDDAVRAISGLFGVEAEVEPYSPDGTAVYRLTLTGAADGLTLTLWPSLNRVDVNRTGEHGWVLKNVGEVGVVDGVQAVFHPSEGTGYLFVSVHGFVNMVMG